ncbi:MAG TPA: hypothetical protein PLU47_17255 [Azonexus sp.]|nr:hypothetical protein [Azonexus sp.]
MAIVAKTGEKLGHGEKLGQTAISGRLSYFKFQSTCRAGLCPLDCLFHPAFRDAVPA